MCIRDSSLHCFCWGSTSISKVRGTPRIQQRPDYVVCPNARSLKILIMVVFSLLLAVSRVRTNVVVGWPRTLSRTLSVSTLENTFYCLLIAVLNNLKHGVKTTAAASTLLSDLEIYSGVYQERTAVKFR